MSKEYNLGGTRAQVPHLERRKGPLFSQTGLISEGQGQTAGCNLASWDGRLGPKTTAQGRGKGGFACGLFCATINEKSVEKSVFSVSSPENAPARANWALCLTKHCDGKGVLHALYKKKEQKQM